MGIGAGDSESNPMVSDTDSKGVETKSPFETQIFQITAQGGARCFYTHASILSKCSQPLRSVVEGNWKESSEHVINLNDWDGDTVERMVQFLHANNYQWPIPKKRAPGDHYFGEGKDGIFTFASPAPNAKTESFEISRPLTPIDQLAVADEAPAVPLDYSAWLSTIKLTDHDLEDLLLSHAKIYALASYKDIEGLKRLALDRTLKTLTALGTIKRGSREVTYITELLKYVYENTTSLSSSREPMRKLIVRFTALNLTILNSDNKISGLIGSSAELAEDLMSDVTRRVLALEIGSSVNAKQYISGLEVRIGGEEPWNCVQEYNWTDPNLNFGVQLPPVWLVPMFTEIEEQACTSFEKAALSSSGYIHDVYGPSGVPKAKGILTPRKDGGGPRIRHIQLVRTSSSTAAAVLGQRVGRTGTLECINCYSPPRTPPFGASPFSFLHLMWKC